MPPKKDAKGGKGKGNDGSDAGEKGKGGKTGLKPANSINVRHILVCILMICFHLFSSYWSN
jgi:NIMA-interacting peptidyl-prolyl cis-trans isomerase 4